MGKITNVIQQTSNRFLNMYEFETVNKTGKPGRYFVASRAEKPEDLKVNTRNMVPDGVVMYMIYGEKRDRVVLIRQYRWPIGDYIYEFPAGLVDKGESFREAAVREAKEETGLNFHPVEADPMYEIPRFMTGGLTDECCAFVYGYADGEVSDAGLEESEEIEVILADRDEVRRIMREEKMAQNCAMQLMHFLHDEEPLAFLEMK